MPPDRQKPGFELSGSEGLLKLLERLTTADDALQAWRPQVLVDAHEQGPDAEFYFDPAAEPYGPFFPPFARRWFDRFGQAYAQAFDAAGFEYMTRERYNYFYPGYTTSYGSYPCGSPATSGPRPWSGFPRRSSPTKRESARGG